MCAPAFFHTHMHQNTDCYHYNTRMFDEQYCQQAENKGNKRVCDRDIL